MTARSSDAAKHAFDSAIEKFKKGLKNPQLYDQILQTTSIDQVYDATDKLQKDQSKNGRLRHLSKIEPFLNRLREYSSVVDTFVQAKPDILALIWGPIKLLLLWADVLKQSFDAISDTLEEVGSLLPEFCAVTGMFADSVRLQEILVLFFRDILDLYLITIKFFSSTRLKNLFEVLWPSQRDQIKLVTKHIARHREMMRTEVRLEEIRAADEARERELEHFALTEENAIKQEYSNLRTHISPKGYDRDLDRIHSAVVAGTGKWLFSDQSFKDWVDHCEGSTRILWLKGIPGAGMFLYVKVIFGMIQYLDNVDEILDQLKHLPESLDDAYGRIFQRINTLADSTLRRKAHRILGWVGCAPSPMTRHELEQALVIDPEQPDQEPRVNSELNVVEFCGPIVEVIDDYVQFVHFTVKE
ncbi:hypothetical protein NW757_013510 [Fusarium falciforme]|nr:hypothetical protein NW757_013510 [Fusarium falciforme]